MGTLIESPVYRQLPTALRARVDAAILLRPRNLKSLEDVIKHFDLENLGISPAALRSYADRLERIALPAAAGQVLAAVFGWLPEDYRQRLLAGTQVLLLSRVVQALSSRDSALSVAELARLGAVLAAMQRPGKTGTHRKDAVPGTRPPASGESARSQPARIAELVRSVYGLNLAGTHEQHGGR